MCLHRKLGDFIPLRCCSDGEPFATLVHGQHRACDGDDVLALSESAATGAHQIIALAFNFAPLACILFIRRYLAAHALTPRQSQILDYIRLHLREHGYPPTLREIGAAMSIGSTNCVSEHLRALQRKGAVRVDSIKSRGIVPTDWDGNIPARSVLEPALRRALSGYHVIATRDDRVVGDLAGELAAIVTKGFGSEPSAPLS